MLFKWKQLCMSLLVTQSVEDPNATQQATNISTNVLLLTSLQDIDRQLIRQTNGRAKNSVKAGSLFQAGGNTGREIQTRVGSERGRLTEKAGKSRRITQSTI